uniref:Uncharacterized protein n=1 Tax=Rhizophora mucronata TaxID=61149 RepID=A0A2P2QWX9_RHIMU
MCMKTEIKMLTITTSVEVSRKTTWYLCLFYSFQCNAWAC